MNLSNCFFFECKKLFHVSGKAAAITLNMTIANGTKLRAKKLYVP